MGKHVFTPGPWEARPEMLYQRHSVAGRSPEVLAKDGSSLAKVYRRPGARDGRDDEGEANAALISAAPDGLTANRLTVGALQEKYMLPHDASDDWIYDTLGSGLAAAYFAARAAISKATGGDR